MPVGLNEVNVNTARTSPASQSHAASQLRGRSSRSREPLAAGFLVTLPFFVVCLILYSCSLQLSEGVVGPSLASHPYPQPRGAAHLLAFRHCVEGGERVFGSASDQDSILGHSRQLRECPPTVPRPSVPAKCPRGRLRDDRTVARSCFKDVHRAPDPHYHYRRFGGGVNVVDAPVGLQLKQIFQLSEPPATVMTAADVETTMMNANSAPAESSLPTPPPLSPPPADVRPVPTPPPSSPPPSDVRPVFEPIFVDPPFPPLQVGFLHARTHPRGHTGLHTPYARVVVHVRGSPLSLCTDAHACEDPCERSRPRGELTRQGGLLSRGGECESCAHSCAPSE
eukprot:GHVU01157987.1.p1 GENE.GHVU01157987.1~~GHVU01157987.1.p1  ORF type:complete len:338 (+),score=8.91 GHVU01157987.1:440-1453(+)